MSSMLKELAAVAAKVAADKALKGKGLIKDAVSGIAVGAAAGTVEKVTEKAGELWKKRCGNLTMKLPFFKSTEDKIAEAFEAHPERQKVCFHFTDSIRDGVSFYDPDGNEAFSIRKDKGNLKKIDLYKGERFAGRIEKVVTFNINPLSDLQRYSIMVKTSNLGMIRVEGLKARPDYAFWKLERDGFVNADNVFVDEKGEEFGRLYNLGSFNYVIKRFLNRFIR